MTVFVSMIFGFFRNKQDNDIIREVIHWICYLLLVVGFLFLLSRQGHAGIMSSWIGGTQNKIENPCKDANFQEKYGKYCSGFLNKEIRCLTDGKNVGVCDGAAVCGPQNQGTKHLCEKYCLNTSSQNLGNQYIQIQCRPYSDVMKTTEEAGQEAEQGEDKSSRPIGVQDINTTENLIEYSSDVPFESHDPQEVTDITEVNPAPKDHQGLSSSTPPSISSKDKKDDYQKAYFDAITQDYRHYFWSGMAD